jgi:hypothetical protein
MRRSEKQDLLLAVSSKMGEMIPLLTDDECDACIMFLKNTYDRATQRIESVASPALQNLSLRELLTATEKTADAMKGFLETLELLYNSPEEVTLVQAELLFDVARCDDEMIEAFAANAVPHQDIGDVRGQAWMALALVQNLDTGGYRFPELLGMEGCAWHALDNGFREAADLLYEGKMDMSWCGACCSCGNPEPLDRRDALLQELDGKTIAQRRLQLELLLASGEFFEAADLLRELDCDAIPDKWEPKTHGEFPKHVRNTIWIWLLIANRIKVCKDIRILVCGLLAS